MGLRPPVQIPVLLWGSSRAASSLTLASAAWLVTGLSRSPLVISVLMALATLPALLPLRRRSGGYVAQLMGVVGLIGITVGVSSLRIPDAWLVAPVLLPVLLFAFGQELSQLPLQRQLLGRTGVTVERLRIGSELGPMAGNLLEAFIFPALAQFTSAFVLLLPLGLSTLQSDQPLNTTTEANSNQTPELVPFSRRCVLQGVLFGSLFAVLPLWLREVCGASYFDFGLLLACYCLGRSLNSFIPIRWSVLLYAAMAALLVLAEALGDSRVVAVFLPLGALAAASDAALVASLKPLGDAALRWEMLLRSGGVGGLIGSLGMGLLSQVLGITAVMPLQVGLILALAWPLGRCAWTKPSP